MFYSENNLPKIKDLSISNKPWWVWINRNSLGSFVCEYNNMIYFNNFGVEHIPKEIKKITENKNTTTNIEYEYVEYKHVIP